MPTRITRVLTHDIRFPTSRTLDGSDAMNPDPDYSAAYVVLQTDHPSGLAGHGLTFTLGRGNEVCVAAIEALAPHVVGRALEEIAADMAGFWRDLVGDSQVRWLGPEKGVVHLATAALVNAVWDLYAKVEGKPLWKLLADMTPEQLVACIDFRYIEDALTPAQALDLLLATGEHVQNRVIFKQLLQLEAIDFCQVDSCRLGGVNEVLAVLLLAAKFGVPVCPHAGGVGLCEYVQHLAIFDYIAVSGSLENRVCEYVDHLHEHFVNPVQVVRGHYRAPLAPGYSAEMHPESIATYAFPHGGAWPKEVAAV